MLKISLASLLVAAFADGPPLGEILPTVVVMRPGVGRVTINRSDYDPVRDTLADAPPAAPAPAIIEPPAPAPVAPPGDGTPLQAASAAGSAAADQQPKFEWADPAARPFFVNQLNNRWFVVDAQNRRYQKGQSAAGYDTQEQAQAQAQKMAAPAA